MNAIALRRAPDRRWIAGMFLAVPLASVAAWLLWQGIEFPSPVGVALIVVGLVAWTAAVGAVWFGPLPDGRGAYLVGTAITVSTLALASIALGGLILVVEVA